VDAEQNASSAQLRFSIETEFARPARDEGINSDATPIVGMAYEFVTHDEWRDAETGLADTVQFTPTDSSSVHVKYDFVGTSDNVGNVVNLDNSRCSEYQCLHDDLLTCIIDLFVHASSLT
jgi:hypothetical protein